MATRFLTQRAAVITWAPMAGGISTMMRAYLFAAAPVAAFSCLMTDGALVQSLGHRYWRLNFEYSNGAAGIDVAEADFLAGGIDKAVGGIAVPSSRYPGNTPNY